MKKVKFTGVRPMGTIRPRRMWRPGDVLNVENDVAKELTRTPGFTLVKGRKRRK